jgi:Calpain family cysteine protease
MRIEGGQTGEALPVLTGAPAIMIDHREVTDYDRLWSQLFDFDKKKYVMATTVQSSQVYKTKRQVERTGLLDTHAYSLVACNEIQIDG